MSKVTKPKDLRITLLFIPGQKYDRSGMVAFADVMGCRTKFFVSKDSSIIPSPSKQRFECIFTGKLESIDRKNRTATAFAKLVRNVPLDRIPSFEEKAAAATAKIAPPPAHDMGKGGELLTLLISSQEKSTTKPKRHKRHHTGTAKGPTGQKASKTGGWGESKKVKSKRRKRQKLATAA